MDSKNCVTSSNSSLKYEPFSSGKVVSKHSVKEVAEKKEIGEGKKIEESVFSPPTFPPFPSNVSKNNDGNDDDDVDATSAMDVFEAPVTPMEDKKSFTEINRIKSHYTATSEAVRLRKSQLTLPIPSRSQIPLNLENLISHKDNNISESPPEAEIATSVDEEMKSSRTMSSSSTPSSSEVSSSTSGEYCLNSEEEENCEENSHSCC